MPDPQTPAPDAPKKKKVLLVEDEVNIASMVQDWLAEKYQVVVASDGKSAVRMAAEEKPDIILEDINLPDMTGFDVIKIFQKDPRSKDIPVIILTGQKMVEETIKFISTEKSVKGFVNKPFKLKEFFEKIELVLGNSSAFVLMEKQSAATQESAQKAQLVREARKLAEEPEGGKSAGPAQAQAPSRGKAKRGFFRVLVSALFTLLFWGLWSLLAAGAASELTLRLVGDFVEDLVFLPPLAAPPGFGIPATISPGAWQQGGVSYQVNSLGLRDEEPAPALSTGSFRALLLGGTAVFGQGVPLGGTVSKRLETLLNGTDLFASTGSHRVLHGALWGLSAADQWTVFEGLNPRLKPDAVLWIVGDARVRRPTESRLEKVLSWPSQVRPWAAQSRLAGFLEMLYLYGGAQRPAAAELAGRVNRFLEKSTGTVLVVLKLGKDPGLDALAPRGNLLVFNLEDTPGLDLSPRGLTAGGHDVLARTLFNVLKRYKDRIKPSAAPAAPGAAGPEPAPRRKKTPPRRAR